MLAPPVHAALAPWLREQRSAFDAVVFDIDGVLLRGQEPIAGAPALLEELRGTGMPFSLLTNDGCHSPEQKSRFLRDCGMRIGAEDVVSCGHGLEEMKARFGWSDELFFVLGRLGEPCYAERIGLRVTRELGELDGCAAILIGERHYDWHDQLTGAYNFLLRHPRRPLVAPNPDETYPHGGGQMGIASGAIARLLQRLCAAAGVAIEPIYLGKPYATIFEHNHHFIERRCGRSIPRRRVLLVGDSLVSDIPGGNAFGYTTALALTGMSTPAMLAASRELPHLVFRALQ